MTKYGVWEEVDKEGNGCTPCVGTGTCSYGIRVVLIQVFTSIDFTFILSCISFLLIGYEPVSRSILQLDTHFKNQQEARLATIPASFETLR